MVSRRVRRRRRQVAILGSVLVVLVIILLVVSGGGTTPTTTTTPKRLLDATLSPAWRGSGHPVTLAFGGDVHFEGALAQGLQTSPASALDGVGALVTGAGISMGNLESAITDGTCPDPQPKTYIFYAPPSAFTALHGAGLSLMNSANNHAEDCGPSGLQMTLSESKAAGFPLVGIGQAAAAAYAPHVVTVAGQRIAFLGASQLFDPGLQGPWSASASNPGAASALDEQSLVAAVESARAHADTVVVFLTWGADGQGCPTTAQPPLARALVRAGADIVVGSGAHVQLGAGYLGTALVDYGLGNLAFYDSAPPESISGSLLVTVTGRRIDGYTWRPAVLSSGLPQLQTGAAATAARQQWAGLRRCTGLAAAPGSPLATRTSERTPVPASATTTIPAGGGTTTTIAGSASSTTPASTTPASTTPSSTTPASTTPSSTTPASTTTLPPSTTTTNNAGG